MNISDIENEISQLENQLDFLEKVYPIQLGLEEIGKEISCNVDFKVEKIIHQIHFTSLLSDLELCYLTKHILIAKSLKEKQYSIKLAHLNIYEFSLAYNKKIQLLKTIIPSDNSYFMAFKHICKFIKRLKERHSYDVNMKFIRNEMSAHSGVELSDYIKKSELLNEDECLKMISDFKHFHTVLFMFIALLQNCHYNGLPKDFDVEDAFKVLAN